MSLERDAIPSDWNGGLKFGGVIQPRGEGRRSPFTSRMDHQPSLAAGNSTTGKQMGAGA